MRRQYGTGTNIRVVLPAGTHGAKVVVTQVIDMVQMVVKIKAMY